MRFTVDPASPVPPYEQLRRQVVADVEDGTLRPGTRLPTVRGLADDLGVAPGTVARAYKELELAGVVDGRGRAGTFVAAADPVHAARAAATAYAQQVKALGVDRDQALELVRQALGG